MMVDSEMDSVTEDVSVTLPDIRALVAERQRFDDWLTALEAKRAETPIRVFERVHGDYVARRDAVIEGLHAHVGSLESLERDLNGRLQLLEAQLDEREDARAEGMLRTAVGEFDSDRWETTRQEVEAAIAQFGQDREALMAEIEDVRSLLASARHRPPAPEPEPEPEPLVVSSVPDVQEELVSTSVASAIAHADPAAVEHTIDLDAEGALTPSFDAPVAPPVAQAPTSAHDMHRTDPYLRAVRQQAEASRDIESAFSVNEDSFPANNTAQPATESDRDREANAAIDALGFQSGSGLSDALDDIDVFGESNVASRPSAADTFQPRSANDPYAPGAQTSSPVAPPASTNTTPPASPSANVFDEFAFLRSVTESGSPPAPGASTTRPSGATDQAKTLRCTECGTMNFPTEWYCERCGGELAAF
ncbi:MAG: hypothetical protein ABI852_12540 [Gemmatimonadaceae bacterium]